ncbi:MAG: type II toxin-antitoxin system Phd/YefM family antitoxin [Candidatus Hydrogenedentes bacterium]|nr:type II toxin-antitoxin system Phd/YefM family antitoxin [Candidatus Hydrogenedentota bacterium]
MKLVAIKETNLSDCVKDAQRERVVITRNGKPVALMVGVEGIDKEQLDLGSDPAFWKLITERRAQLDQEIA